jgi:hypothetical protein
VKFEKYEVIPLKDHANPVQCETRNAQFWGLYGIDKNDDAYAVGDFSSKTDAEFIKDAIQASP